MNSEEKGTQAKETTWESDIYIYLPKGNEHNANDNVVSSILLLLLLRCTPMNDEDLLKYQKLQD